jgi:hypothetical protein
VEKPLEECPLGRPKRRWDEKIKMGLREEGCGDGWSMAEESRPIMGFGITGVDSSGSVIIVFVSYLNCG